MTSSGLSPRCSAPMVTAYRRASYAEPCRISASTLSSPRAWAGCDSMVAIGQDQSLSGAEGNHRGRVARQLGVVADPVGAQMRGWIDGAAGEQVSDANLGHDSVMAERPCAVPSPVDLPAARTPEFTGQTQGGGLTFRPMDVPS